MTDRVIWLGKRSVVVLHPLDPKREIEEQLKEITPDLSSQSLALVAGRVTENIDVPCLATSAIIGVADKLYCGCVASVESDIWRLKVSSEHITQACSMVNFSGVIVASMDGNSFHCEVPASWLFKSGFRSLPNWIMLAVISEQSDDRDNDISEIRIPMKVFN